MPVAYCARPQMTSDSSRLACMMSALFTRPAPFALQLGSPAVYPPINEAIAQRRQQGEHQHTEAIILLQPGQQHEGDQHHQQLFKLIRRK